MSVSDFLELCHHNELEEGVDLATASSSHSLPPFPRTRLCNYLCDVGQLQQKSLGDLCHHPHESWGNRALRSGGALVSQPCSKWVSPPTDHSVVLGSCALGIAASCSHPREVQALPGTLAILPLLV